MARHASHVLGQKLDSIPFSSYHLLLIIVLGTVGFVEGYDLALGGSLIVLAREPLHLTPADIRWLVAGPTFLVVIGGFTASVMSDRMSRKAVMQIGVIVSTLFTLLIPLAQSAGQLIALRLITGLGLGSPFPRRSPLRPS
jgi:MFS family permease